MSEFQNLHLLDSANSTDVNVNVFFATLIPILSLVAILLNLATIVAFWQVTRLREKPSELLILNLSCADLFIGLLVFPIWSPVYITPGHWPMGENGCRIAILVLNMGVHGSLFALLSISIDRFLLISMDYPRYVHIQTTRMIKIIIALTWILSFLTVAIELGFWNKAKTTDKDAAVIDYTKYCLSPARRLPEFSLSFFLTLYLAPVLIVCTLSIAFVYLLHRRLKDGEMKRQRSYSSRSQIEMWSNGSSNNHESLIPPRHMKSRYVKPAITLIALVSAMTVCMLPYCLYVIITDILYTCPTCKNVNVLYDLLLLQFCNAILDPFLYAMTKGKIRKFYRRVLYNKLLRKTSSTPLNRYYR